MKRKLIRQGDREHGSYTITLPARWIKAYGLNSGDEIEVEEMGESLLLFCKGELAVPREVTIDARKFTSVTQMRRYIAEAYRSGVNTITVLYVDKDLYHTRTERKTSFRKEIESMVPTELLGMELEKVTSEIVIIQQFSEAVEEEFEAALKKIFFKLQDQIDESILAIQHMNAERLRNIWQQDRGVNKFCNFCMRILNKKGHMKIQHGNELYAALVQLELMGDLIYMIPLYIAKYKVKKAEPELCELLNDLKSAINSYREYFYNRDESQFENVLKLREKYYTFEMKASGHSTAYVACMTRVGVCYELLVNLQDIAIGLERGTSVQKME